jgi:hypothetical protein
VSLCFHERETMKITCLWPSLLTTTTIRLLFGWHKKKYYMGTCVFLSFDGIWLVSDL